jgi:Asp-tRNA(Asn)/Glu-tRNA(Gln) amidotransferase A subunit family amidase
MGMRTTAGAVALLEAEAPRNARVVDKVRRRGGDEAELTLQLLEAGAVILGKTTVSVSACR